MVEYRFVDLFCGAGGLSLGLCQAGLTPVLAVDWDRYACDSYRHNIKAPVLESDLGTVDKTMELLERELAGEDVFLVAGGPPCQGLSTQRRGPSQDPRNDLLVVYTRTAVALQPSFIIMENVPGLLGKRGRPFMDIVQKTFEENGYSWVADVLNAANYGVPQQRNRAVIVAWRGDIVRDYALPASTLKPELWRTVRDGIGNLPEPPTDFTEDHEFPNHVRFRITPLNQLRISYVPPGGGRLNIPEELQLDCHKNGGSHRHLDVFGRMEWDRPSPTITAMFDSFTRGRFAHPAADRPITNREGARLQGFPDDFRFIGPKKEVAKQIGNSVPPPLAKEIGVSLVLAAEGRLPGTAAGRQLRLSI